MPGNLLEVDNVDIYYGSAQVIQGLSLSLTEGESVALLGRNGAGKTTIISSIMSLLCPRKGAIFYRGEEITGLAPHLIAKKGLSMVPEGRHIFPALSVMDHLRVPVSSSNVDRSNLLERVFNIFPELLERKRKSASSLSGGEQQMLVIARALMTDPKLLLLDEPMEGLAPKVVDRVIETLKAIQNQGVSIFFASNNLERALRVAERAYVLETGKVVFEFNREKLENSLDIVRRYLGIRE